MRFDSVILIPWIAAASVVLCGLCCTSRRLRVWSAPLCIAAIGAGFVLTVLAAKTESSRVLPLFGWIRVGNFHAAMSYFIDPLTILMLYVVTGIGALVAIYAAGYMAGDRGYARFFTGVSLFIFAMTTLVMADNLVLLYLGWEGVGLCSYLLIGYYYHKPSAVAAAKKAFIVNRVGDLGFAMGIFLVYQTFGTVSLAEVIEKARLVTEPTAAMRLIPFLLMLGAFGKSAQLPLYVWLPDAMEGPTPVSALIHAATMVTAGVYMVARLVPVFELSPYALPTVAVIGGLTAVFAATIALCQYDLKRIWAYSTVSQLGYMFLGAGVLSTVGGMFHLLTHAFFKALLFLTAGSVMHALAGQLDLRKISGLRRKMPLTALLMLIGALALAGSPLTAGFYSKDLILADAMARGLDGQPLYLVLAVVGLVTALLTAFYSFRLWFRVFMGPAEYEMGHEQHDAEERAGNDADIKVEHHHEVHEVSWLMNLPLVVLAVGALGAGYYLHDWVERQVTHSTAGVTLGAESAGRGHPVAGLGVATNPGMAMPGLDEAAPGDGQTVHEGLDTHQLMQWISGGLAVLGIFGAAYFHWWRRDAADAVAARWSAIVRVLANKYYVDELYDRVIVRPLWILGQALYVFDRLVIDGLVALAGFVPKAMGLSVQPAQRGQMQGYGLAMLAGIAVIVLVVMSAR